MTIHQLIWLYCTVCRSYSTRLAYLAQHLSNNDRPQFTDEELMTVYLWGILQRRFETKAIYEYTKMHYHDWFPRLPSYQAFNRRLGELAPAFQAFAEWLLEAYCASEPRVVALLLDSMPIIVAKGPRSSRGKVAGEVCSQTYSSSKKLWYYGVELHMVGSKQNGHIPLPVAMTLTTAKDHDLPAGMEIMELVGVTGVPLFADKAYCDSSWKQLLWQEKQIRIETPRKKPKGIDEVPSGDSLSNWVCSNRQPIESFFNWLNEKTNIQVAPKARSLKGLLLHIFSRIASAFLLLFAGVNY